ncbi:AAA family ATPase [Bacteroides thetaiotaomicron]|uniref:AAA family ATPase n=1 Tax=Bacteroides thetaiotaomicron TaxID=818 RepID=UPI0039C222C6
MIKNIKLKNFKVFEDEDIELAPLTLITGINGMGKSSVIQSLLLLKQSYEIGYLELKKTG